MVLQGYSNIKNLFEKTQMMLFNGLYKITNQQVQILIQTQGETANVWPSKGYL